MNVSHMGRWRVVPGAALHWRVLEDVWVVFNGGSGDTHRLDPVAAQAVQSLDREPASVSELAERLAKTLDLDQDDDLYTYLERLLPQLARLNLIERGRQ
jgi:PqqD family protein of HPr-rel-A system